MAVRIESRGDEGMPWNSLKIIKNEDTSPISSEVEAAITKLVEEHILTDPVPIDNYSLPSIVYDWTDQLD